MRASAFDVFWPVGAAGRMCAEVILVHLAAPTTVDVSRIEIGFLLVG